MVSQSAITLVSIRCDHFVINSISYIIQSFGLWKWSALPYPHQPKTQQQQKEKQEKKTEKKKRDGRKRFPARVNIDNIREICKLGITDNEYNIKRQFDRLGQCGNVYIRPIIYKPSHISAPTGLSITDGLLLPTSTDMTYFLPIALWLMTTKSSPYRTKKNKQNRFRCYTLFGEPVYV